ncbi:hypothetical protein [Mesorhizobium australicum]|uniref:hypothetical protein n=1 Tax=Mesorhizobium australicum TaxID=536018 RepID=UPI00333C6CFB
MSIFFRDLLRNTPLRRLAGLGSALEMEMKTIDPWFQDALWSWSLWPHGFAALRDEGLRSSEILGDTLCLHLWAWGDTAEEVNLVFKQAFENLRKGLESVAAKFS